MDMVILVVGNSITNVRTKDRRVLNIIRDTLSYKVKNYEYLKRQYKNWDGTKSFFDMKSQSFLSGFLPFVTKAFNELKIPYKVEDTRFDPLDGKYHDYSLKGIKFYDYQKKAIEGFLKAKKGICKAPTGAGKTLIAIAITKALQVPTLFLTHRVDLLRQTANRYASSMPEIKNNIGIIQSSNFEPRMLTFATVQTLYNMLKKDYDETEALLRQYQLVIVDEAHRCSAKQFYLPVMACKYAYYKLALTATPFMKEDVGSDMQLYGLFGDVFVDITIEELINSGVLAKPFFKFIPINSESITWATNWRDIYEYGIIHNEERNNKITEYARQLIDDLGKKILIIVNEVAHGKILLEKLQNNGHNVRYLDGSNTTYERERALKDIEKGRLDAIIATNIFDEGIDVKSISGVILGAGTKAAPALFQRTGRAIRKKETENYAIIIDFIDKQHPKLLEHSKKRFNMVKNTKGFEII
jgi:superfamily II DNA or RNA helicase